MAWLASSSVTSSKRVTRSTLVDWAPSAPPSLTNERLAAVGGAHGEPPKGKVGWTDVATFAEIKIPATNFGAGDPLLAHRSDEFVTLVQLDEFARVLPPGCSRRRRLCDVGRLWLVTPQDRDDLAEEEDVAGVEFHRLHRGVLWLQHDAVPWGKKRFTVASPPGISATTISPLLAVV